MNFSKTQQTGELAELAVRALFTEWLWTPGRDFIDVGYDFNVEPDHIRFHGQRFLVQVKGTARAKKGAPTASVSKANLRKYVANHHPVFLVRSSADGTLHWLHVQRWAALNMKRLSGNGYTNITLPADQVLADREEFSRYLDEVMKPVAEKPGGAAEVAAKRSAYLSSIDPRVEVRVSVKNGAEQYEISAKETFDVRAEITSDRESALKLDQAVRYGLPAEVEVESIRMSGSGVLAAIGGDVINKGVVSIAPADPVPGRVTFYPGRQYSILARELVLPSHLHRGTDGFSVTNDAHQAMLGLKIIVSRKAERRAELKLTMSLREKLLRSSPIREHHELGGLGDWAEEVLTHRAMLMDLNFLGRKARSMSDSDGVELVEPFLRRLVCLSKLHRLAKLFESNFQIHEGCELTSQDASDIEITYAAMRGERKRVFIDSFEVGENSVAVENHAPCEFRITTALTISVAGQQLGTFPVGMELYGYRWDHSDGLNVLKPTEDAVAVLYHNENGSVDRPMVRPS